MEAVKTDPDFQMQKVKEQISNIVWIYKSAGGLNNKEVLLTEDGNVMIENDKMGYWGVQGSSLYLQISHLNYRQESMVAIYIS